MIIKMLKIGNDIYQNVEYYTEEEIPKDSNGNPLINSLLPTDLDTVKQIAIDTINWWLGDKLSKSSGNLFKLSAANSKAIVLLVKILYANNMDVSGLTDTEKTIYDDLTALSDNGYSNSELLLNTIGSLKDLLTNGETYITNINNATTIDDVIAVINSMA